MYAVKALSRDMAAPKETNFRALERLGRYLKQNPRYVSKYPYQEMTRRKRYIRIPTMRDAYEREGQRVGGVIMLGRHCIKRGVLLRRESPFFHPARPNITVLLREVLEDLVAAVYWRI